MEERSPPQGLRGKESPKGGATPFGYTNNGAFRLKPSRGHMSMRRRLLYRNAPFNRSSKNEGRYHCRSSQRNYSQTSQATTSSCSS